MLDREIKNKITDYFDAPDLVDFLQIDVEDIVEVFEEEIEENLDEILEIIGLREEEENEE